MILPDGNDKVNKTRLMRDAKLLDNDAEIGEVREMLIGRELMGSAG